MSNWLANSRIAATFPLGPIACGIVVLSLATGRVLAQPAAANPAKTAPPPAQATSPKNTTPQTNRPATQNPLPDKDEAERQRILDSRQWHETIHAYNEWLSVQKIYAPADAKKMRAELNAKIAQMSAGQLRDFLADSQEKMKILMSKEAEDARLWLAQRMAVEVRQTPAEIKESRPDIVKMTSAQLEQNLRKIEEQRTQIRQTQKGFDKGRQQQVKSMQHTEREAQREREEALDRAAYDLDTPYGSYYQPPLNPGGIPSGSGSGAPSFWFGYPY